MNRQKMVFVLDVPGYVRHFFESGVLDRLREVDLTVLANEKLSDLLAATPAFDRERTVFYRGARSSRIRNFLFTFASRSEMYRRGKLNPNFRFRLRRELFPAILRLSIVPALSLSRKGFRPYLSSVFRKAPKLAREFYSGVLLYLLVAALSSLRLDYLMRRLYAFLTPLGDLGKQIAVQEPGLVVIPTVVVDPTTADVIRISRKAGALSFVLVDNWDNLSSKSSFVEKPDYVGVMGPQAKEFAMRYHDIPESQIKVLGNPRFEVYRKGGGRSKNSRVLSGERYILFAGCQVAFDEIGALEALAQAMEKSVGIIPGDIRIRYRPHPFGYYRSHIQRFSALAEQPIDLDPQLEKFHETGGDLREMSLGSYPDMLRQSLFVVTPLSTILLEATLMQKRVVALAHDDNKSLLSPNRMLKHYSHFRGIENLPNVKLVTNLLDLPAALHWAVESKPLGEVPEEIEHFLAWSGGTYSTNLRQAISEISESKLKRPATLHRKLKEPAHRNGI